MMRILFPVSECVPFVKTGGLADVAGALPQALASLGHDVHVVMPFYPQAGKSAHVIEDSGMRLRVPLGDDVLEAEVHQTVLGASGPTVHLIKYDPFFDRHELYRGHPDNDARFAFFSRAVLEWGMQQGAAWDIVHCHDWHTGLIPVMLKLQYADTDAFRNAKSLITIHNLAYQGHFSKGAMHLARLPWELFHAEALEFYGGLNFLKAGLVFADWINTVSQTYAREIQTAEAGYGLEGVLQSRRERLSGIVNGIDYQVWDPGLDAHLPAHFTVKSIAEKQSVKQALLEKTGLIPLDHAPVLGMITRLDDQKGLDIFADALTTMMQRDIQIVILGTGEKKYHDLLLRMKAGHPRKLSVHLEFNNDFAHLIYGGSDMFLMPSKYEPCGLGQLISMKYGTIPVVRRTGGLADTVQEFDGRKGTGFLFQSYDRDSLNKAVFRAMDTYRDAAAWNSVVQNAMQQDYSWAKSAAEYIRLYGKMLGK